MTQASVKQSSPSTCRLQSSKKKESRAHSKFKKPEETRNLNQIPLQVAKSYKDLSEEFSSYALSFKRILFLRTRLQKNSLPTHSASEEFSSYALGFRRILFLRTRFQKNSLPTHSVSEEFSSRSYIWPPKHADLLNKMPLVP